MFKHSKVNKTFDGQMQSKWSKQQSDLIRARLLHEQIRARLVNRVMDSIFPSMDHASEGILPAAAHLPTDPSPPIFSPVCLVKFLVTRLVSTRLHHRCVPTGRS
jgi:hypothetical protein